MNQVQLKGALWLLGFRRCRVAPRQLKATGRLRLTRLIWMVVLIVVTILLALVFGRFERPRDESRPAPSPGSPVLAAPLISAGLGSMAILGITDDAGSNGVLVSLPLAGMVIGVPGASASDRLDQA